ncbi:DUF6455 family protein [Consotaella salsifontis]|uniref:DUF6455 family protein n=1 Tax=Consotaella salsifontis TaxID=1365950 RepID=UPI003CC990CD
MGVFEWLRRRRRRRDLCTEMMKTIDVQRSMLDAQNGLARRITDTCRACPCKRECRAWLRWRVRASSAPGFCPNASIFASLGARSDPTQDQPPGREETAVAGN